MDAKYWKKVDKDFEKFFENDKNMCKTTTKSQGLVDKPLTFKPATETPARLPVVQFEYPESETDKMKLRYVRVSEANDDYIKGEEIDSPGSKREGQFKSFKRTRMVRNGVALLSF